MNECDEVLLIAAIDLAASAQRAGELPYGSLLADRDNTVLATEYNTVASTCDITAHPELKLARLASTSYPVSERATMTLFTSCQPCEMCAAAIARAGLGRVVFALSTAQLRARQPSGAVPPSAADLAVEGPALLEQASAPIDAYYGR